LHLWLNPPASAPTSGEGDANAPHILTAYV
jgi:hypothetical protein